MRELTLNEILITSGGHDNNGYNFSYIVKNTLEWGFIGVWVGILFNAPQAFTFAGWGAIGGATYATAMMVTTAIDNYAFPETKPLIIPATV